MNTRLLLPVIVLTMIVAVVSPLRAHHSIAGIFDVTKPAHIEGKVVNVAWGNPHVVFTLAGKEASGAAVEWRVEASAPDTLSLLGWSRETLMPGMNVRVGGYAAKMPRDKTFASTTVTILATQRVLKTPVCWFIRNEKTTRADVEAMNAKCPIPEVP